MASGIFGKHFGGNNFSYHFPIILGCAVHISAYLIAFFNLPANAPMGETEDLAYIKTCNPYLAIFGSFLIGFGDACYNTQIYSLIGSVLKNDSAAGFAIVKFFQSAFAAAAFFYSNQLELPYQLLLLIILCICGTITFCTVKRQTSKNQQHFPLSSDEIFDGTKIPAGLVEDNSCGIIATNAPQTLEDQITVLKEA